ncbi:MAG TPA: FMN-binding protein [Anaeromyxobacteraceae bacterium]|jgi:Na+-translocating ferredoxin:NAD+ oxidoreductase RnfG subunit|nr:FMN-binding protein [Anaeromyxobacteraceae bacterium]
MRFGGRGRVVYTLLAPASALVAPAPALAVEYLTVGQAQAAIFPDADAFEARELSLDSAQQRALEAKLGGAVRARWPARLARRGGRLLGVLLVDEVIGKFERITFATGVDAAGAVRQVEILVYRESHGHEVRLPAWRKQFVGKTAASPLQVGEDIANISGATLSCRHVAQGVRRDLAVVEALRRAGALP